MKNEYIEVVKSWLAGEVVSVEALKANADRAAAAYDAAADDALYADDDALYAALYAAYAAAAYAAAYAADDDDADAADADYWVKRYEELTNDK